MSLTSDDVASEIQKVLVHCTRGKRHGVRGGRAESGSGTGFWSLKGFRGLDTVVTVIYSNLQ